MPGLPVPEASAPMENETPDQPVAEAVPPMGYSVEPMIVQPGMPVNYPYLGGPGQQYSPVAQPGVGLSSVEIWGKAYHTVVCVNCH
jgi:hypothetical protein